jgi:hypothetical protein
MKFTKEKKMKRPKLGLILLFGLSMTAFNLVTVKHGGAGDEARLKKFEPQTDRALVYVYRDNSFLGQDTKAQLIMNDRLTAENNRNEFSVVSVEPGAYKLICNSSKEGDAVSFVVHNAGKKPLEINLEAGKIYFVQQVFKAMSGFSLKIVEDGEARKALQKMHLQAEIKL